MDAAPRGGGLSCFSLVKLTSPARAREARPGTARRGLFSRCLLQAGDSPGTGWEKPPSAGGRCRGPARPQGSGSEERWLLGTRGQGR